MVEAGTALKDTDAQLFNDSETDYTNVAVLSSRTFATVVKGATWRGFTMTVE